MKTISDFIRLAALSPDKCKIVKNSRHTTYLDLTECVFEREGCISWKKSMSKEIHICRDGDIRSFEIVSYIARPSEKGHDAKVVIRNKTTKKEYKIWCRDLKQGDVGKLFR